MSDIVSQTGTKSNPNTQQIAADLAAKGYHVTSWSRSLGKRPGHLKWEQQARYPNPGDQIGLIHGLSHTVCLDVDDLPRTRKALASVGINLDKLLAAHPKYYGAKPERPKIIFALPHSTHELDVVKVNYPKDHPEKGEIFSLRGSNTGGACQDVLPGSIHPTTKQPYRWYPGELGLPHRSELKMLPPGMLSMWERWKQAKPCMEEALGWQQLEPQLPQIQRNTQHHNTTPGTSPLEVFNATHTIEEILHRNGYKQRGNKWLSPYSSTGDPGVSILVGDDGKRRAHSHHGSEPWQTEDAWGLFVCLEHNGDHKAAAEARRTA